MRFFSWIVWTRDSWEGSKPAETLRMKNVQYHLFCHHHNRLDGEAAVTQVEQVLKTGPEEVDNQDVVKALLAKVIDIRNTRCGKESAKALR
jgi:hypothetical protein